MKAAALLLLGLSPLDDKDDLKKAFDKTAALTSYFYQWELTTSVKERSDKLAGAGEFVAPDLLTARTGILELVKKGDRTMARGAKGWVKTDDDSKLKTEAEKLRAPHEIVGYVVDSVEKTAREKDADVRKAKCRVFRGSLDGDGLKGLFRAGGASLDALEKVIDWKASTTTVHLWVEAAEGRLVKMVVESELVISPEVAKNEPSVKVKRTVEFMELNAAKPSIVPQVKEALGIKD
jgi:hypothetical protein